MGEEAGALGVEEGELVLDEGAEAAEDADLGEDRVAGLGEALEEEGAVDLGAEEGAAPVVALDLLGGGEQDAAGAEGGDLRGGGAGGGEGGPSATRQASGATERTRASS